MESADKELYPEFKKGEKSDIKKVDGFNSFISEMKKVDQIEKARIEGNRLFYENRREEILAYRKRIVEAKTLFELHSVRDLITNRISLLGDRYFIEFPDLKTTISELNDLAQYVNSKIDGFKTQRIDKSEENTVNAASPNSQFSVLEWATIFYYANQKDKNRENLSMKERMNQFIEYHNLGTTFGNLKAKYYTAQKSINKKNDYPIAKLEKIMPFLKSNYPDTIETVISDKEYLIDEQSEN